MNLQYWDALCRMAEKSNEEINGDKITDILSRVALFLLPDKEVPTSKVDPKELYKIAETFKIPFPEIALHTENTGCFVLVSPQKPGIENDWFCIGYSKNEDKSTEAYGLELMAILPLKITLNKKEDGPELYFDPSAFKEMRLYGNQRGDFKFLDFHNKQPHVGYVDIYQMQMQKFNFAFHVFSYLECDIQNFILETTPKKVRKPKPGKIPRSHERPYYTLLTPKKIRKKLGIENQDATTGSSPTPHERRGHWRTYRAERYKNMRGKRQWIDPVWIGTSESMVGNKIYKVRLDL